MRISRRSVLAFAAAAATSAHAQENERLWDLVARTREARLAGDVANWRTLGLRTLAKAPDHPDLLISAARASAAAGDSGAAVRFLNDAAMRGAGFEPARFPEFATFDFGAHESLIARTQANLAPVRGGARFADLPGPDCEGVEVDPVSRDVFTGSSDGRIFAVSEAGEVRLFAEGLQQVLGLKVDRRRRLLWVVSGRFPNLFAPNDDPEAGKSGLRLFDLRTGAQEGAWDLDERPTVLHGLNDIALARNGDVYVTDTPTGAVYRLTRAREMELFYRADDLTFINGIVISPDQRTLYVAHVEGLSAIDIRRRTATRLPVPADVSVNSIDGLSWLGDELIGVQPSPYLARLLRIRLNGAGDAVVGASPILARTPAEYSYTTCAVGRDAVYLVGGAPNGSPYGDPPLVSEPSPHLWRVPV